MNPIIIILGVFFVLIIILTIFIKKKGSDTPESLIQYFSPQVKILELVPPFSVIFKFHSNDGNQIIFIEKTNSRKCFLKIERYKLILEVLDKDDNQTFYTEDSEGIFGGMEERHFVGKIHNLYVNQLHKALF
jgi:hypothetical protein